MMTMIMMIGMIIMIAMTGEMLTIIAMTMIVSRSWSRKTQTGSHTSQPGR